MNNYNHLKNEFESIAHINYLIRILGWEEAVFMPHGAGQTRAEAVSTLKTLARKMSIAKKICMLIEQSKYEKLPSVLDDANLKLTEKYYTSLSCIPSKLFTQSTKANLNALQAWRKYREKNNWKAFCPIMDKSFLLQKKIAEIKSQKLGLSPYDVLLDSFAPGLKQENIDKVFTPFLTEILPLREKIISHQEKNMPEKKDFPLLQKEQKNLFAELLKKLYFDFEYGRFDECSYAYCDGIATDIRITMSCNENNFLDGLFALLHETGHAVYEQSMPKERCFQLVGQPQCKLIHESMAFIYEREIGLSKSFFKGLYSLLNSQTNIQRDFTENELYVDSIRVQKHSLIRVTADEVNYPLHIILRYEIEKALFNGNISMKDVPDVWNEKMKQYFGISTENNYKEGPMQDVHWPFGYFGYFPIYLCAQLMASQIFEHFTQKEKFFTSNVEKLDFSSMNHWLKEKVYQYGGGKNYQEILLTLGENELTHHYFIQQLNQRYLQ
jgi:carboxypeptidase Taq